MQSQVNKSDYQNIIRRGYWYSRMSFIRVLIAIAIIHQVCTIVDRTYYIYLGLDISASPDDIAQAYASKKQKIMAIQQQESKNSKLKILQEAYQVLGNAEKRVSYDKLNRDLFSKSQVLSNLKKLTDKNSRKGKTMQITLPVSVEDVYHGKTIQATFSKQTACDKCKGTGAESPKFLTPCSRCGGNGFSVFEGVNHFGQRFANENTCNVCQGWGKQITKVCPLCNGKKVVGKLQKVKIKIPKGLPDGNIIKIANFGDEPIIGAPSDLQVKIVEIPTQRWSRQGEDLIYTVQISLKQAIFGFTKKILHLNENYLEISRSEVTTRNTVITIPDNGIENIKTGKKGKLLVKFKIIIPKFNDEQLDMWQQFFKAHKL